MSKKLTTDEFIEKSKKIHGNKYNYSLVEYKNTKTNVKIICKEHGVFEQKPNGHLGKLGCSKCKGGVVLTTDEFIFRSNKVHNFKYNYSLVNYINTHTKVDIICPHHGVFHQEPTRHIGNQGCPKCANNILYSIDYFIKVSNKIHNFKYNYSLVKYENSKKKVKIICPVHGIFEQLPTRHMNGMCCQKCEWDNRKLKYDEFLFRCKKIHNNKYDYSLIDYKNARTKVEIICPYHGIFKQSIDHHIMGVGCPICSESKGEKEVSRILDEMKIKFIREKRFNKCRYKNPLPFDFYLPDYNLCIEYDGVHHFMKVNYWGGDISLSSQQKRDNIKTQFCLDNNIKLLRIRYDENINEKLEFLKNNGTGLLRS